MMQKAWMDGATIVFGGSGGIGQEVAKCFGRAGSDVAIVYRSKQTVAERVAAEIASGGRKATCHAADVRDPAQVQAAVDAAIAAHGRIHTVVWAAGPVVEQVMLAETPAALWRNSIEVEVHGFLHAVQATLPHLRARGGGSYVHLGSAGHVWWPPKDGLSVVPKAANEALIKGIAKEEGRHNIRANSVLVGVIEAGMFLELLRRGVFDEKWTEETQKLLCIKRWGKPEEIGDAAVFLATNGYVTGQQINVSGGFGI
ncbi:NAD(P)-dependent dehydrogenase, short-chain alcohol dehydrogenase family [Fontimonas thermophila]|uniref:NAD(P)-dependent dehydrogenase, short-chain alcohol dehydrogenase family n=1 Tax=Fontimonas thermophila TaxID=1076937 RepID=A0A1I2H8G7_9GAMM|nr:SDR family oxidoreductase [Fontimonas thermophila]SFF26485.1 NAD(P)-dependent dehydrogenase, short-chain alcohol dehydrogenase family [Fontimonas thermophila]